MTLPPGCLQTEAKKRVKSVQQESGDMKHLFDEMGLLVGWQEIADYLRISVSTVKRWNKHYGLPVFWKASGRPFTLKSMLDKYHFKLTEYANKKEHNND